ncbi:MAG: protein TolQ [Alcanivoracaceae bacterium]|jgi:biopolymer transport protein TolQ|nr:protein TolQ [Alcanivoracaceae bacterium]
MHDSVSEMTIWGLVSDASLVVQLVMLILVLASVASWYLILSRHLMLRQGEKYMASFLKAFREQPDLQVLAQMPLEKHPLASLQRVFLAGYAEYQLLHGDWDASPASVQEGVERVMQVAVADQEAELETGLSFLATVGSVSPYIGLFGTVWGIMNSFIGLSQVQQATLSTVAPGIAEALIATAIGLFAAIPAVIAYNRFSARGQRLIAASYSFGTELQQRLHRLLYRNGGARVAA